MWQGPASDPVLRGEAKSNSRLNGPTSERGNHLGATAPEHHGKWSNRADQEARRINKIDNRQSGPVCKTSISGSNPDGASIFH